MNNKSNVLTSNATMRTLDSDLAIQASLNMAVSMETSPRKGSMAGSPRNGGKGASGGASAGTKILLPTRFVSKFVCNL